MDELDELRLNAYENAKLIHDRHNLAKYFEPTHQVLLYNSRLIPFKGKLKFRWYRSYTVIHAFPHRAIAIKNEKTGFNIRSRVKDSRNTMEDM